MEARTPQDVHPLWVKAHNVGDLDGMMALCELQVCFVTWSGRVVAGADAVREAYRAILANKPQMELDTQVEAIGCGMDLFNHPTAGRITRHGDTWRFVVAV